VQAAFPALPTTSRSFVGFSNLLLHPRYHACVATDCSRKVAIAHLTGLLVLSIHAWTALCVLGKLVSL
jgi:hypothetical protein